MARPLRVHISGALYHVMSRGNARQEIFVDPDDYQCFLERLTVVTARVRVRCRAYCLMPNHFHLLLEPGALPLSKMMQQLNSSYTQWFKLAGDRQRVRATSGDGLAADSLRSRRSVDREA